MMSNSNELIWFSPEIQITIDFRVIFVNRNSILLEKYLTPLPFMLITFQLSNSSYLIWLSVLSLQKLCAVHWI
jgi:hypothetical protein